MLRYDARKDCIDASGKHVIPGWSFGTERKLSLAGKAGNCILCIIVASFDA